MTFFTVLRVIFTLIMSNFLHHCNTMLMTFSSTVSFITVERKLLFLAREVVMQKAFGKQHSDACSIVLNLTVTQIACPSVPELTHLRSSFTIQCMTPSLFKPDVSFKTFSSDHRDHSNIENTLYESIFHRTNN